MGMEVWRSGSVCAGSGRAGIGVQRPGGVEVCMRLTGPGGVFYASCKFGKVYGGVFSTSCKFGKVYSMVHGCKIHLENFEFCQPTGNWRKSHQTPSVFYT